MTAAVGLLVAPAVILSAAGYGASVARVAHADLPDGIAGFSVRTAAGLVVLGAAGFLLLLTGLSGTLPFAAVVGVGLGAAWACRQALFKTMLRELSRDRWIVAIAAAMLLVDTLAATMPMLDADSNAYHFTLPLQFLARGELFLVPRAVDGAVPLLFQTIYVFGLRLGGELGMLLLAKLVVWLVAILAFGLLRQRTGASIAGLTAFVVLTMPALVYSMGTGQVEGRIALLTLASAAAIWTVWNRPSAGTVAIAGLLAGGVAAGKFTGLLFLPTAGLMLLAATRNPKHILAFAAAALIFGGYWYGWLWSETGSPLFPMFAGPPYWGPENQAEFASRILAHERAIPANLGGLLSYPFHAFLATHPGFEADRTGPGPAVLALVPAAILGACRMLRSAGGCTAADERSALRLLTVLAGTAAVFYVLWWYFGVSQRLRHLLPVLPLFVVALGLAASEAAPTRMLRRLFLCLLAALALVQAGGWAFYHRPTVRYALSGFPHEAVLARDLQDYEAIRWMRTGLPAGSLLVLLERRNNFYLDVPFYRVSSDLERLVGVGDRDRDPERFLREVRALGGTHILFHLLDNPAIDVQAGADGIRFEIRADIDGLGHEGSGIGRFHQLVLKVLRDGCGRVVHMSKIRRTLSRTLAREERHDETAFVVALTPEGCRHPAAFSADPANRGYTDWGAVTAKSLLRR